MDTTETAQPREDKPGSRVMQLDGDEKQKLVVYLKEDGQYRVRNYIRGAVFHDYVGDIDIVHQHVVDHAVNGKICVYNTLFPLGVDECFKHQREKYAERVKNEEQ